MGAGYAQLNCLLNICMKSECQQAEILESNGVLFGCSSAAIGFHFGEPYCWQNTVDETNISIFFVNVLVLCAAKHSLPCITAQQATETGGSKSSKEPSPGIGREEEVPKQKSDERSDPHESEKASPARMVSAVGDDVEVDTATQQRAMSPGTLALMCDEKDPLFTAPPSPSGGLCSTEFSNTTPSHPGQLYAEQERAILLEYRECLRRIIAVGKRRGV